MPQSPRLSIKSAGNRFRSATAAVLEGFFLEIKGLAAPTPPVQSGSRVAQFSQFSLDGETPGEPIVPSSPKKPG